MNREVLVVLVLCLGCLLIACKPNTNMKPTEEDEWNGGYCKYDNTRLEYIGTGNKEHFKCTSCDREYTFSRIYPYKDKTLN